MKNLLKKISAVAMAFTMLGTGTAISKNSPKPTNTLTAHAEFAHNCWSYKYNTKIKTPTGRFLVPDNPFSPIEIKVREVYKCAACGNVICTIREYTIWGYEWDLY